MPWGESKTVLEYKSFERGTEFTNKLYGGLLTENVVQAIARDVMAEAMLRLEKAGYPVVLTVHDEVLCEHIEEFGGVTEFCEIMAKVPSWAPGLPVAAAGWRGNRYKK
jgi:DNA polymerase